MTTRSRTVWRKSDMCFCVADSARLSKWITDGTTASLPRLYTRNAGSPWEAGVKLHSQILSLLTARCRQGRCASRHLLLIENGIGAQVTGPSSEQLLLAIHQIRGIEPREFKSVPMGNRIRRARLDTIPAEDTAVVVDVVHACIALGPADTMLGGVLGGFDVDAVRRAGRCTKKTRDALLQPILVALQDMHPPKALLKLGPSQRPRPIGIVLHLGGLKHLAKSDAHAFRDRGHAFQK